MNKFETIILKNSTNCLETLNEEIKTKEDVGFVVVDTQVVAGNSYSKYTATPTVVVIMQRPI